LKRRKIEQTQLPENFEAAQDDIPYLDHDVDVGMGIDFGGDGFFFSFSRLKRQRSHLGNDLDMGGMDEAIDLRHSSEVEFSTIPAIYINVVHIGAWSSSSSFTPLFRRPWREQSRN
jgi:hypothetical protein